MLLRADGAKRRELWWQAGTSPSPPCAGQMVKNCVRKEQGQKANDGGVEHRKQLNEETA